MPSRLDAGLLATEPDISGLNADQALDYAAGVLTPGWYDGPGTGEWMYWTGYHWESVAQIAASAGAVQHITGLSRGRRWRSAVTSFGLLCLAASGSLIGLALYGAVLR